MGKLRNGGTEIEQFTQWMGRKCRNHHPLEELNLERKPASRTYAAKSKGDVSVVKDARHQMVYQAGGRAFLIEVKEVEPDLFNPSDLEPVGF